MADPAPGRYLLRVQQQPTRARLCSFKEANDTIDRRPVDPPPVVEVYRIDGDASVLEKTCLFVHAALVLPQPDASSSYPLAQTPSGISATTGETIQTPEKLRLMDERQGALCVFAKLSVRMPGMFRLKFTLYETSKLGLSQVGFTITDPFEVFSPKLFTGMRESTMFTRHLAMQGIKVKLRTDTSAGRASASRRRPAPSLVWDPRYDSNVAAGDDGLVQLAQLAALTRPYAPPGPPGDLSLFSLERPPSNRSRGIDNSAPVSRSDSPSMPAFGALNLRSGGDDGIPSFANTQPVVPHLSNILGPPDGIPPKRY